MENGKKRSAIASKIPWLMDGGRANPAMLGWGAARGAGAALAGRSGQVRNAIDAATGSAPVRAIAAPAGKGGMSRIRDGATPPAHMLAAQRRGMADGGMKRGNAGKIERGDGGAVKGPGGPTDDRVGPVALANTEYVLPGDTVQAMGGPEALDQIRAATHKFVDQKNKPAIAQGMADGGQRWKSEFAKPANKLRTLPEVMFNTDAPPRQARAPVAAPVVAAAPAAAPPVKTPWRSEFAKDNIPTMGQAVFGTRPASAPGVAENIGTGARATADAAGNVGGAIGQAARNLETTRKGAMTIANNIPGAIAAPIANAVDSFGADIRTGYTGEKHVGREFVGKPMFDGSAQAAAPAQQPAATPAQPAPTSAAPAAAAAAPAATAQVAPATGTSMPGAPSVPTIGKVNASRQPNGVMSFSGKDQVDGYAGAAAGQLKGGGSSGAVTPADYQAAVARGEKDKAGVVSMAASYAAQGDREGAYRMAAGDPAAAAAAEQAFQQRELRIAALNGNKQAALMLNNMGDNETARLRIASDLAPKPETAYDKERTRGAKADNDRAAVSDSLIEQYMNAPDDKTRNSALERLNALGGKNSADKYITIDVDTGQKDAVGNPIYAKAPFNTRTGQVVSTSGAGQQGGAAAPTSRAEYDTLAPGAVYTGPDGIQYTKGE